MNRFGRNIRGGEYPRSAPNVQEFHIEVRSPIQQGNPGEMRFWDNGIGRFFREFFAGFWWGARTLWRDLWWSRSVRVLSWVLWLASLILVIVKRSPGTLFLFELASGTTVILWIIPVLWGAYRLCTIARYPLRAGWCRADVDLSKQLRSDWMEQIRDLGFNLVGYLTKVQNDAPRLALFINFENRDSASIGRVAGHELLVFKTRFADGSAFETGNTVLPPLRSAIPNHPVFRFPQIRFPSDLYRVHQRIKNEMGLGREAVIANGEGEIAEFISRAEVVRSHIMSRDYQLRKPDNVYVFTVRGGVRQAALLTWPVKPIREAIFRRKALNELSRLGFQIDKRTRRIVER
jgi:hypothetical protein